LDGTNYQASVDFLGVNPGSYTLRVRRVSDASCESSGEPFIIDPAAGAPEVPVSSIVRLADCGNNTADIKVSAPLGAAYEYSLDGSDYQASVDFLGVNPGSYTLRVRRAADTSCESSGNPFTIDPAAGAPETPTFGIERVASCDNNTADIKVSAPLGPEYVYSLDGTNYQASVDFLGVNPGSYTLRVRRGSDASCESSGEPFIIDPAAGAPEVPVSSIVRLADCGNNTADIKVSAPLGAAYEYSLDGTNYQASVDFLAVAPGSYTLTVRRAADTSCENSIGFTVDNFSVDLTLHCPVTVELECGETIEPDVTGFPEVITGCGEVVFTYVDSALTEGCTANTGVITRIFTGIDSMGNQASCEQTIVIHDSTAPVFEGNIPEDLFIGCDETVDVIAPIFTDSCSGEVTLDFSEREVVEGECTLVKKVVRTWVASDTCGNEAIFEQTVHSLCKIEVYNAVSPNNNGANDFFYLKGIECYPDNNVKIFNRWGVLVYETENYDNVDNAFRGVSEGRVTIDKNKQLPSGDYFYLLEYRMVGKEESSKLIKQSGHLYISN
jgi:gliding motility-associated-like protein